MRKSSTTRCIGVYSWRKRRRLLVLSDHIRLYRATRVPHGQYLVPLPGDLIEVQR
jgi:hypothetical protein